MAGKSKSKSRKIRTGHKKLLVPKWKLFRTKEPLISVFMWGVNHMVKYFFYLKIFFKRLEN